MKKTEGLQEQFRVLGKIMRAGADKGRASGLTLREGAKRLPEDMRASVLRKET